ncbi:hypothetical protein PM082_019090 [Marasmius tenuissimus]|nr:hypothetical protein PM082_019090 [Marasmius tenuissimus]
MFEKLNFSRHGKRQVTAENLIPRGGRLRLLNRKVQQISSSHLASRPPGRNRINAWMVLDDGRDATVTTVPIRFANREPS